MCFMQLAHTCQTGQFGSDNPFQANNCGQWYDDAVYEYQEEYNMQDEIAKSKGNKVFKNQWCLFM